LKKSTEKLLTVSARTVCPAAATAKSKKFFGRFSKKNTCLPEHLSSLWPSPAIFRRIAIMSATVGNTSPIIPRPVLWGAGAVVAASIVIAAIGAKPVTVPPTAVVAVRTLAFADAPDGAVLVTDAANNAKVARLAPGTNGFIRATLRTLAHAGSHELVPNVAHPFLLTAYADGRLVLDDAVSGRKLDLEAFGSLNSASFAALLTAAETP